MSFLSTMRSIVTFGASTNGHVPEVRASLVAGTWPSWQTGKPQWPAKSIETFHSEYAKLSLVFRCVGLTASSVGAAPVRVYAEDLDGNQETLPRHPMRLLMRRPNPQMRESRFLAFVAMLASVTGFALVEKERSAAGRTVALWPLRSDWARPILRSGAPPDWEYRIGGSSQNVTILKAADVLHFTYADRPDGSAYGIGALEVILREVGLLNVMTDFLKLFFDRGAMPVYGLMPDPAAEIDQTQAELIKEKFMRRYAGLENSIDPMILVGIQDIKRLSFDFNELAFNELRDVSDLAICSAFGIPPGLVGVRMGLERNTFANAQEMRRSFYEDTISPLWSRFDDVLTLGLLPEFEPNPNVSLEFDTSDIPALQENRNDKATWLTQAYLGGGITAHTFHAELGLPLPEGKDYYLRGFTVDAIPANTPVSLNGQNGNGQPAAIARVQPPLALPATTDEDEDERAAWAVIRAWRVAQGFGGTLPGSSAPPSVVYNGHPSETVVGSGVMTLPDNRATGLLDQGLRRTVGLNGLSHIGPAEFRVSVAIINRRTVQRIADTVVVWMRAFFRGQSNRVTPMQPVDWTAEERALGEVIARIYDLSGRTAYDAIAEQYGAVGISWDLANPNLDDVRTLLAHRVTGMNDESRSVIQNVITDGLKEGKSLNMLSDDLKAQFADWSDSRAMTISRTESQVSFNSASAAGYRESGVVDRVIMYDNSTHDTDPMPPTMTTCADRDGMVVDLDEIGAYIASAHPNCILATAGVLTGEQL